MINENEFIVYPKSLQTYIDSLNRIKSKSTYAIYKRPYLIPVTKQTFIELGVPVQYFKEAYYNEELCRKVAATLNRASEGSDSI